MYAMLPRAPGLRERPPAASRPQGPTGGEGLDGAGLGMTSVRSRPRSAERRLIRPIPHELGCVRFGSDPKTSVLNERRQCWTTRNVLFADGAAWPTSGWQNPTLTMIALAGLECERLVEDFKAGTF